MLIQHLSCQLGPFGITHKHAISALEHAGVFSPSFWLMLCFESVFCFRLNSMAMTLGGTQYCLCFSEQLTLHLAILHCNISIFSSSQRMSNPLRHVFLLQSFGPICDR